MDEIKTKSSKKVQRKIGYHVKCNNSKYKNKMEDFQKVFGMDKIVSKNLDGHYIIKGYSYGASTTTDPNKGDIHIACDNCLVLWKADGVVA